ncbi:hypothetical protein Patl1_15403 [Pistacia atlantica]|uniref:Uncharacterized protein n=1 Tax=Pistacia atlantica TaxID=434234 RepID=A0ACC1B5G3_9ROSI|nr:hypothetical protein Patl1_15403 [Pistacia atlantica]
MLKESCMELVTKKTEFLDRLMGNLNSFGEGVSENSLVGESPLPAVKEYLKESLNQVHLQQQAKIIHGDWKHIVVCGLKAQQLTETCDKPKTPKSQLVKKQQQLPWSQTTRSRRHKLDADTTRNALPPSYHQHDINQLGANTTANAILFSDHHHDIAQKQDHPPEGQLRPSKAEDQQQCSEQKLRHQPEGQLRPSKAEGNGDQQKAPESHRDNEHPHRSRSRARTPCRPKLDADATMSVILPLPSDQQQNIEQKLQHQPEGQGRPSNAEGNKDHHRSLRFYVRRKHRQ